MRNRAAGSLRKFAHTMRRAQTHPYAHSEEGSTLVEIALSMLMLVTFLFGVMECGLMLYTYHYISDAAREGTRYAIVRGSTCTGYATACPASANDIQSYVTHLGFPGINSSNLTVQTPVWTSFTNGSSCPATPPCNSPGNQVSVTVQYDFHVLLPFVPAKTFSMTSKSAMIISQ